MTAPAKSALVGAAVGFAAGAAVLLAAIFRSTSSTAAIGILFIPFASIPFVISAAAVGYGLPDLAAWLRKSCVAHDRGEAARDRGRRRRVVRDRVCRLRHSADARREKRARDERGGARPFLDDSPFGHNKFALGAVVTNPAASAAILDRVARMPDPELQQSLGSLWPVTPDNGRGLAVAALITRHPNVSEDTLAFLAGSPVPYIVSSAAANPKTRGERHSRNRAATRSADRLGTRRESTHSRGSARQAVEGSERVLALERRRQQRCAGGRVDEAGR